MLFIMDTIKINDNTFSAYTIPTPNVSMMVITTPKGMLACGYISVDAADKFNDALAIVRGVSSYDDMLKAKVSSVSKKAEEIGVSLGMTGEEALIKMK